MNNINLNELNNFDKALKTGFVFHVTYYGDIVISTNIDDLKSSWDGFTTLKDAKKHALEHGNFTSNRLDAMACIRSLTKSDLINDFMNYKNEGIQEYIIELESYINKSNTDWEQDKYLNNYKPYGTSIIDWKENLKLEIKNLKMIEPKFQKYTNKLYK
tara:strand:+ start:117 stop:590 length:474 start_codon:yes stop_codon:yes gene_type:complete